MRIGILGGSFNPPHQGHIHISLEAKKKLGLQQIWWVPAKQNPFKKVVSTLNRFDACKKITKSYPQILVKDLENQMSRHCEQSLATQKPIYTIDLLRKITKQFPRHQFFWIMGADNILQFHLWKNWRNIIKITPLIICDRDDYFYQAIKSKAFLYARKLNRIQFLKIKKSTQSSTKIRKQNGL